MTLRSIHDQQFSPERTVVVWSGGDDPATRNQFGATATFLKASTAGQVRQRREGMKFASESSWFLFLDDDVTLRSDAVLALHSCVMGTREPVDVVGLYLSPHADQDRNDHGRVQQLAIRLNLYSPAAGKWAKSGHSIPPFGAESNATVAWVSGGAALWKASVALGLPDPVFSYRKAYAEDRIRALLVPKGTRMIMCQGSKAYEAQQRVVVRDAFVGAMQETKVLLAIAQWCPEFSTSHAVALHVLGSAGQIVKAAFRLDLVAILQGFGRFIGVATYPFSGAGVEMPERDETPRS